MGDRINRLLRARHSLLQELGREPTMRELSEACEEDVETVAEMLQYAQRTISLETPVGDEADTTLSDFIEDEEAVDPEEVTSLDLLQADVYEMLSELPPREARVLQLRYGLRGDRTHTLSDIGKKMGISRERVRQIEAQAKRRIRSIGRKAKLAEYVRK
jgi:RNA polymerase primary sigma factor